MVAIQGTLRLWCGSNVPNTRSASNDPNSQAWREERQAERANATINELENKPPQLCMCLIFCDLKLGHYAFRAHFGESRTHTLNCALVSVCINIPSLSPPLFFNVKMQEKKNLACRVCTSCISPLECGVNEFG